MARAEVAFFAELNSLTPRVPRSERMSLIKQQFASVDLDWDRAFSDDVALMGRLIGDILKLEAAEPGKPGPRSSIEYAEGIDALRRLIGDDYSMHPFPEAIRLLRAGRSLRALSLKLDISKSQLVRLLDGVIQPTPDEMQRAAKAFGKHPSYFLEWRTMAVAEAIRRQLIELPEASVAAYRQLVRGT